MFKSCPLCGEVWATRDDLLGDPAVVLVGYQVSFIELMAGLFLFTHACGTTFAIPVAGVADLYDGPIFALRATGSAECPTYCLQADELRPCPAQCECAAIRELLPLIAAWPKRVGVEDADTALPPQPLA
jgi:hypothetical protein